MTFLILLIVLGVVAYRVSTPAQRTQAARQFVGFLRQAKAAAEHRRQQPDPFRDALRARTRWTIVTPALVAANVVVFVRMVSGSDGLPEAERLVAWGASFGPRTTNGEWWRLGTSLFVHTGFLHLLVDLLAIVPLGLLIERLIGRAAFAAAFVSAGVFANLGRLSAAPIEVHTGASGAIFGIYALLAVAVIWSVAQRSTVVVPLRMLTRICPGLIAVLLYYGFPGTPEYAGGAVGFACGLWLGRTVGERKPAVRRVAVSAGVAAALAFAAAVPIRGVTDVRPELAYVSTVEETTASTYTAARGRFTTNRLSRDKLIAVIDGTILPELEQARSRLAALEGVPDVHQPLVDQAQEFLRMRDESWRLRADGLRKIDMLSLRRADAAEQASLAVLKALKAARQP